jgi:hypothetical protein
MVAPALCGHRGRHCRAAGRLGHANSAGRRQARRGARPAGRGGVDRHPVPADLPREAQYLRPSLTPRGLPWPTIRATCPAIRC